MFKPKDFTDLRFHFSSYEEFAKTICQAIQGANLKHEMTIIFESADEIVPRILLHADWGTIDSVHDYACADCFANMLYENLDYMSPNEIREALMEAVGDHIAEQDVFHEDHIIIKNALVSYLKDNHDIDFSEYTGILLFDLYDFGLIENDLKVDQYLSLYQPSVIIVLETPEEETNELTSLMVLRNVQNIEGICEANKNYDPEMHIGISINNALSWLIHSQGYMLTDLTNEDQIRQSPFLSSLNDILNSSDCNTMQLNLPLILDVDAFCNIIADPSDKFIHLNAGTELWMFDTDTGEGSPCPLIIEKAVSVPQDLYNTFLFPEASGYENNYQYVLGNDKIQSNKQDFDLPEETWNPINLTTEKPELTLRQSNNMSTEEFNVMEQFKNTEELER